MATGRIKKAFTNIPAKLADAVGFITAIAEKQRAMNEVKREAKKKIEAITAKQDADLKALRTERDAFFNALFAFAGPRKQELTAEARTVKLASGTFGWRWTPPSVVITNGMSDADVIGFFEKHELDGYVRTVKEVNREALLRDRLEVPFITYEQREEFFAKPKLGKGEGSAEELSTDAIDR